MKFNLYTGNVKNYVQCKSYNFSFAHGNSLKLGGII